MPVRLPSPKVRVYRPGCWMARPEKFATPPEARAVAEPDVREPGPARVSDTVELLPVWRCPALSRMRTCRENAWPGVTMAGAAETNRPPAGLGWLVRLNVVLSPLDCAV